MRVEAAGLMDFWPEFLANSWGREFVAGGFGGTAGVIAGYPLDTLRIRQQHSGKGSAWQIFRRLVAADGPFALYRGMAAPLASVTFQRIFKRLNQTLENPVALKNAIAFQTYAILSKAVETNAAPDEPPSYAAVALGGFGTGAIQSLLLSPVELVKIRLQLQPQPKTPYKPAHNGPTDVARAILRTEGVRGLYRGLTITALRDAPAHSAYFLTYEYVRERLHPGCRKNGQEAFGTMLLAGGLAGVASWICCYPLDVIKTRIQAQPESGAGGYGGIVDCFRRSVREEGYNVLWRGLGTAVMRAFIVNGAIFTAYETALRFIVRNGEESRVSI